MFISHLPSRFVPFTFVFLLISNISSFLNAGNEYTAQIASTNCTGLASCAITNCPDLPFCIKKREGDFWIHCQREGCVEMGASTNNIKPVMTVCDYKCTKTPLPLLYDVAEALTPLVPGMAVFDCAALGSACAIVNAMRQGKDIPIKRVFAYACVGGLSSLSMLLANGNQANENLLYTLGGTLAIGITSEYVLK
jgi:hypothetical protein